MNALNVCKKCGFVGEPALFRSPGVCWVCYKAQQKERWRKYKAKNKEKLNEQYRKYQAENKEKINEQHRKYWAKNKEKLNEQYRKSRANRKHEREFFENMAAVKAIQSGVI